jgi:cytochrome c oxidase subunit 4
MESTEHPAHHHDPAEIDRHVRVYMIVFATLAFLTVVTVGVSYLHLSTVPAIALGLLIASVKASLVACYFMHLISERKLIVWIILSSLFFFLGVLLGPVVTEVNNIHMF